MMKSLLLVFALISLAAAVNEVGICRLVGTATEYSAINGYVMFSTDDDGTVNVHAQVNGLTGLTTGNEVGIHVHTYGDIRLSDSPGANAGGHYNPTNVPYGCPGQPVREYGDMGNWTVTDGSVDEVKNLDLLSLTGGLSIIGRSVVVHHSYDNCQQLNSSSTRMAFCVIGIANTTADTTAANGAYNSNSTITYGTCSLQPVTTGNYAGLITFSVSADGILVRANVTGITGTHGIHIHALGDLNGGNTVGGHYDPLNTKVHALPGFIPDAAHHVGDLGNICDSPAGSSTYYYQANFAAPKFADQAGIIGRAIVLHAAADDNTTTLFGARVAYCVIGVAAKDNLASTFATPPVTFTSPLCGYSVPTPAPGTTSDATDLATISVFIAITTLLAMLF